MMEQKQIYEIRAALEAAAPGPWEHKPDKSFNVQGNGKNIASCFREANAALIANAPTWIAELLEECDRLQVRADETEKLLHMANATIKTLEARLDSKPRSF